MDNALPMILVGLAITALAGFALYKWEQRKRLRLVEGWVKQFLLGRYREQPNDLSINCSDDRRWPVLVGFVAPRTGIRHRLQFACAGAPSTYVLLSEIEEERRSL